MKTDTMTKILLAVIAVALSLQAVEIWSKPVAAHADTITAPASAAEIGRYQITVNPNVRADTTLLDTSTGMMWRETQISDALGKPSVWHPVRRVDSIIDYLAWVDGLTLTVVK